jgi:5-hydroxyisourate hydrolase-like protein (transthyretin family)
MGRLVGALVALSTARATALTGTLVAPALADEPPPLDPTALVLTGPTSARITTYVPLVATLTASDGSPLAGERVQFQRYAGNDWSTINTRTTGADGTARVNPYLRYPKGQYRAVFAGSDTQAPVTSKVHVVKGTKFWSRLRIAGARKVVDERTTVVGAIWRTTTGKPISGVVRLWARPAGGTWKVIRTSRTGRNGYRWFTVKPRVDTRYALRGAEGPWYRTDRSPNLFVDNLPPGRPWRAPKAAPRPKALPAQPRGFGKGANIRVTHIPNAVWKQMNGISWRPGCPVGRSGLRLVRTNYWGFDGYRHRGELVVNASIAHKYVGALRGLYRHKVPIRAMYRVDRFGYSKVSGGGDDFASMQHDNTSAFNCRWVTGNPGVRSPHSTGRAFDINTWENPYRSNWGWLPNRWWPHRSDARVAWRSPSHRVVKILRANGFHWSYRTSDSQHYDGRRIPLGQGTFTG